MLWNRINTGLTLVQLAASIMVLVQYSRGLLMKVMQRLAVASLLLTASYSTCRRLRMPSSMAQGWAWGLGPVAAVRPAVLVHQVTYGLELLLGILSAAIAVRGAYEDQPDIIKD